ncbi:MAG TPA: glutamine--fructose-6-phosphate transaminase (isomerizing) [Rhabdochlamydiaceae bacterium]|nr:glutamine--fructose-6-phosphate transaminase (isomerizing) [Rhabdochlamydiaceae bacterium]
MCGIFGYVGTRHSAKAAKVCIDGLKHLEYRGYDSAGIAGIHNGEILSFKEIGKLHNLEQVLGQKSLDLDVAIAHTRWATHGKPSKENAHPHFDQNQTVAVVHNGIIENHTALKHMLKQQGLHFYSDTDSEVIAQLVAHFYEGDLLAAVGKAISLMNGFWGIAIIHKDHPDKIIAAARENPIAIGINPARSESVISSDPNAFNIQDLDVLFLRNDEIAVVSPKSIDVFDYATSKIDKQTEKLGLETRNTSKNGFEHFMLKEISEQPQTIQQAMHNRFIEDFGTAEFDGLELSHKELASVKRILILACGTSWHAGCIAASLIEDQARIPTHAEIASEFRYKNPIISEDTLVIAISQSGETLDTIAAVREVKSKGAKVLGICNVRNSTLTREADSCLFLRAGSEISVCSTKTFTSTLVVLSLFSLLMARLRHMGKEEGQLFLKELKQLPNKVQEVLDLKDQIQSLARKYAVHENFFFLGRHYMYAASLEAALKLKEISYLNAFGCPAGEMKHGPIALINPELAVIGMCGNMRTYEKTMSNLMEVKARGGPILAFAPEGAPDIEEIATDVLYLPHVPDELAAIVYSIAAQLLAYFIAKERGTDIDQPRNLAKSVTVE